MMIIKIVAKKFSFPLRMEILFPLALLIPYFILLLSKTFESIIIMLKHIDVPTSTETMNKYDTVMFDIPCGGSKGWSTHVSVYKIQQSFVSITCPCEWLFSHLANK